MDKEISQLKNKDITDDGDILDNGDITDDNESANNDNSADNDNSTDDDNSLDEDNSMDKNDIDQEIVQLKEDIWELEEKTLLAERQLSEEKKRTSDLVKFLLLSLVEAEINEVYEEPN